MKKPDDNVVIKGESHLKITDITDETKPRKIFSSRIFNTINNTSKKQDSDDSTR